MTPPLATVTFCVCGCDYRDDWLALLAHLATVEADRDAAEAERNDLHERLRVVEGERDDLQERNARQALTLTFRYDTQNVTVAPDRMQALEAAEAALLARQACLACQDAPRRHTCGLDETTGA